MINKRTITIAKIIISILLIFFLLKLIGTKYFSVLATINLWWVLLAVLIALFMQVVAAINIQILLKALGKKIKLLPLFRYSCLSLALGNVSPGKIGEFSIVWMLKKYENVDYGEGLAISIVDKVLSILVLLVFGAFGLLAVFGIKITVITVLSLLATIILLFKLCSVERIGLFIKKHILKRYSEYFTGFSKTLKVLFREKKRYLLADFIVSFAKWGVTFVSTYFLFLAFNYPASLYKITIVFALAKLVSLIPISLDGLGVKEISGTYLFGALGIPAAIAANVMITARLRTYIVAFIYYIANHKIIRIG